MKHQEFWDRYSAIGEECEEPGLPLAQIIDRLESLARDLRQTGIEPDEDETSK